MRKPVIGVMGGAQVGSDVERVAHQLGNLIAQRGWVLLNGGRNVGVMAASARGAKEAGGTVVGVLPGDDDDGASEHLDLAIVTGMGDARNAINVLTSDVVIACPGGAGTCSEIALALKSGKPVVLLGCRCDAEQLGAHCDAGQLVEADSVESAIERAATFLHQTNRR